MSDALVILSGGQDSTLVLGWANQNFENVSAITFDYNQRHKQELESAKNIAKFFNVKNHTVIESGDVLIGSSPLVNRNEELETYSSFDSMVDTIGDRVEYTFVPMRNAYFMNVAANHAFASGICDLATGVCESDTANYPDCRKEFIIYQIEAINRALGLENKSFEQQFKIHTPLISLDKSESIRLAKGVPGVYQAWAYSHTAYDGNPLPVGRDHASVLRAEGFLQAGIPDPLVVRHYLNGSIALPTSENYEVVREQKPKDIKELAWTIGAEVVENPVEE